jgi:transcriptional regulator with XRE-family HTH domain
MGDFFRERRWALKRSRRDVAAAAGVSLAAVGSWERGAAYPSLCRIDRLAEVYQVSPARMLAETKRLADAVLARARDRAAQGEAERVATEARRTAMAESNAGVAHKSSAITIPTAVPGMTGQTFFTAEETEDRGGRSGHGLGSARHADNARQETRAGAVAAASGLIHPSLARGDLRGRRFGASRFQLS